MILAEGVERFLCQIVICPLLQRNYLLPSNKR